MPDRVDPIGGWFNLGDRGLEELPSLEESRVTQVRRDESRAVVPGTNLIVRRFHATELETVNPNYATYWNRTLIQVGNTVAAIGHTSIFTFPLDFLPVGSTIQGFRFQYKITAGGIGTVNVGFQGNPDATPGSGGFFATSNASVADGTYHIDTIDYSTIPVAARSIQRDWSYFGVVQIVTLAGAADFDINLTWTEITVSLPPA